jgi:hypothetical protein
MMAAFVTAIAPARLDAQPVHAVRVNVSSSGQEANADSWQIAKSSDLRHILFWSRASNLVEGDTNDAADLFVRDRDTDRDGVFDEAGAVATVRVSVGTHGEQADALSDTGILSRDGRFVLFISDASTLVPRDTNGKTDVFLHDRDSDADGVFDEPDATSTTRISEGPGGVQGDAHSSGLVMSPDARFFLFVSASSTFSAQPVHQMAQIYRKERSTGALTLVTRSPNGLPADGPSDMPSMSDDGRIVAFRSQAGNLGGAAAGVLSAYVRDLETDRILHHMDPAPQIPPLTPETVNPRPGVAPDGTAVYITLSKTFYTTISLYTITWLYEYDVRADVRRLISQGADFEFADDPRYLVFTGSRAVNSFGACVVYGGFHRFDRVTRAHIAPVQGPIAAASADASARRVVFVEPRLTNCLSFPGPNPPDETTTNVFDLQYGTRYVISADVVPGPMNADGSELIMHSRNATLLPPGVDNNGANDVYVIKLDAMPDRDTDQLDDRWEMAMGLSITSGAGSDGPSGDPDGDGIRTLEDQAAYAHPGGTAVRYLAVGG